MASDGSAKPYRVKFRAPSFVNLFAAKIGGRPPDRRRSRLHGTLIAWEKWTASFSGKGIYKFATGTGRKIYNSARTLAFALIPMMMYAQDYFGFLSDGRHRHRPAPDLNMTQVTETLAYCSCCARKPVSRYHIQVCTNIPACCAAQTRLYAHVQKRLGIGNKEVSPSASFSRKGWNAWAPALAPGHGRIFVTKISIPKSGCDFEQLQDGKKPKPVPVISGALHERNPNEVVVISKNFGVPNCALSIRTSSDGYKALEKALKQMTPVRSLMK